jgi:hypothetical protein
MTQIKEKIRWKYGDMAADALKELADLREWEAQRAQTENEKKENK